MSSKKNAGLPVGKKSPPGKSRKLGPHIATADSPWFWLKNWKRGLAGAIAVVTLVSLVLQMWLSLRQLSHQNAIQSADIESLREVVDPIVEQRASEIERKLEAKMKAYNAVSAGDREALGREIGKLGDELESVWRYLVQSERHRTRFSQRDRDRIERLIAMVEGIASPTIHPMALFTEVNRLGGARAYLEKHDKLKDGVLARSDQEWTTEIPPDQMDSDFDGRITLEEISEFIRSKTAANR